MLPCLFQELHSFIHSFGKGSLIVSLPGPVMEVGDRERNQTQALYSRSSQLNAGTDTCHESCEDPEGTPEPGLGSREGFTEEKSSGDLFGTGWRMSSIAWELSMQRTSCAKAQRKEVECIRRTAGVQCGA